MMAISFHMNLNTDKMSAFIPKARSKQLTFKLKTSNFSCHAKNMAMQSGGKANFYEVLSLGSKNVGFDEIKKAYRNMALQYHPDVCSDPSTKEESTKRFIELRKAYETLSDPISRRRYDYKLQLVDSLGCNFGDVHVEERRENFPREVWERQLSGLRKRSAERLQRKK